MKKIFTLICLTSMLSGLTINAQTVYDDFDNPAIVDYFFFDGIGFDQAFSNPNTGGINSSALCAQYTRNPGVQFDVIVMDPSGSTFMDDVSDYLSGSKTMSVKVFSPSPGLTVQITLEDPLLAGPTNFPVGRHSVYLATTTATNDWETLTFSFDNQPDPTVPNTTVNRLVMLLEPGTFNSTVWLYDDLMGPEIIDPCAGVTPDPAIAEDYDCQRNLSFNFSNGDHLQSVPNPLVAGINTSSACGKFTKWPPPTNDGAFGGSLDNSFTSDTYNFANIHLYSPAPAQTFQVILQDGNGTDLLDHSITTSSTTEWESHNIDLSSIPSSTTIENVVFLLNAPSSTEDSIYLDNFSFFFSVGLEDNDPLASVSIFPLPLEEVLNITSEVAIRDIALFDLNGKRIAYYEMVNNDFIRLDVGDIAKGSYIVQITDFDGNILNKKIIK